MPIGRSRGMGPREPNGRLSRNADEREKRRLMARDVGAVSPAQVRRLRENALAGIREPIWGTVIGQLFAGGRLSARQFEAARRLSQIVENYQRAIAPIAGKQLSGAPIEPRSAGRWEEYESPEDRARYVRYVEAYDEAMIYLGECAKQTLPLCVGEGISAPGLEAMIQAVCGLDRLAVVWKLQG